MTVKECISLLKEMKTIHFKYKKDKTKLLEDIIPAVSKLRYGKDVIQNIKEAVYADEYDKALKQLRKAACYSKYWPFSELSYSKLSSGIWVSLGFLIFGIVILILGYTEIRLSGESENWPQTTGIIITSYIEKYYDDDGEEQFSPVIEYTYTVYGKSYTSDRRNFNSLTAFDNLSVADSILKSYPLDSLLTVYYNPKKNKQSVIDPSGNIEVGITVYAGWILCGNSLIIIMITIFSVIIYIVRDDKKKK